MNPRPRQKEQICPLLDLPLPLQWKQAKEPLPLPLQTEQTAARAMPAETRVVTVAMRRVRRLKRRGGLFIFDAGLVVLPGRLRTGSSAHSAPNKKSPPQNKKIIPASRNPTPALEPPFRPPG